MPRRSMNGHRVHVILTDPQYKGVNRLSDKSGLGVSELIRRAVDDYLAKAKKK
ncbi:MAG: ribbon-helix-helix protein, CopG family [Anaerolineales bacterium]|nr:ribbon-helix-helix protein, CopG family [Anaerolineales bacterium]